MSKKQNSFFIVISLLGAGAATYSAIRELSSTHFEAPCYVAPFLKNNDNTTNSGAHTNCCGRYQNISRYSNEKNLFYVYLYTKEKVREEYKSHGVEYDRIPTIAQ